MGLVSALMLRGADVVIGYTRPVADALSPWMSSLILWHLVNGLDACGAAHRARDEVERQDWPEQYREHMRQSVAAVVPQLLWEGGLRGALAKEAIEHYPDVNRQLLRTRLQGLTEHWPWQGRDDLRQLLDNPASEREERLRAVCRGLFIPRVDIKDMLAQAMVEQARCLQVFGAHLAH